MKVKYLILIIIFALLPTAFVGAAKQVNGTVPEVQPLQPQPEGIYPNVNNNIQFQDPSHEGQFDTQGNIINGNPAPANLDERSATETSALPEKIVAVRNQGWKYILVLLLLFGGGVVYWKVNRKKS